LADLLARLQSALADRYTIERELGAGGMATVYLAEDLKHHRQVALKVLRQELTAALGAERFHREIQIAAQLQHPNILPLLDSGEAAGLLFYAMPYVEGQSLRERLAREGALPVPDTVRILRDVVDALTEAHAHGVVHRDIKPENILLRGRHALVTDFGVAKAVSEATGRQTLTTAGVALGTPAYMAPEQASADPHLDHRVDIYAVGAVAYELLTGRPVFMGTTPQMVLSAHVTEAPQAITKFREAVPRALEALVMRCLAKQPADRWQSAEELLPPLEALATPSGGITPTDTQPVPAPPRSRHRRSFAAAGIAVVVIAVGLLTTQIFKRKLLTITISGITAVTTEPGVEFQPAISPDGNEVAFLVGPSPMGLPRLFVRSTVNMAGGAAVRLDDTAFGGDWSPSWSPDGQSVRFWGCRPYCGMRETGKLGGAVRALTVPPGTRWSWSADGARVAFVRGDTVFTSSTTDTGVRRVAIHTADNPDLHSLAWSPDAKLIAYVNGNSAWLTSGNVAPSSIWVVSAVGGAPQQLAGEGFLNISPAWLDARHLLFVSNRDGPRGVYVVEVGPNGRRGEPRAVPGIADPHSISYSISSRKLAYAKFTLRQNIWSYPLGRSAPVSVRDGRPVTSGSQVIEQHDVSPDGRWLAFDSNRRGNMDLYKMPLGGGDAVPLTALPGDEFAPRWSPDGKEIAFHVAEPGSPVNRQIMIMPAEGGLASELAKSPGRSMIPTWSPSGLQLVFQSNRTGSWRFWLLRRDSVGGTWHEAVRLTDFDCYGPVWAPDGRGLLCNDTRNLILVSLEGRAVWRRAFAAYGLNSLFPERCAWDGRTIYAWGEDLDGRQGIWAIPLAGGAARLLIAFDDPALDTTGNISVSSDRLYLTVSQYESDIWVANLHW
jgi:Tol biopolymer transport system component